MGHSVSGLDRFVRLDSFDRYRSRQFIYTFKEIRYQDLLKSLLSVCVCG